MHCKTLNPVKITLFGSYVYGTPTPDSDVDLPVVWDKPDVKELDRHFAVSQLLAPRSFPVDILAKTSNEIDNYLAQRILSCVNQSDFVMSVTLFFLNKQKKR